VSAVEFILEAATTNAAGQVPTRDGRAAADRAVWFCACVTFEDAPTWLIYDTHDGKVGWCRVSDGDDIANLVDSPVITGSHVDPDEVLAWLQSPDVAPTPGDGSADAAIVRILGTKLRDLQPNRPDSHP